MKTDIVVDLDLDRTLETGNDLGIIESINKGLTILTVGHQVGIMIGTKKAIVKKEVNPGNSFDSFKLKRFIQGKRIRGVVTKDPSWIKK